MSEFKEGDFIHHRMKGYGFVVGAVSTSEAAYSVWEVFHFGERQQLRRNVERFMSPADRPPTDEDWAAYVAWKLGGGE